MQESGGPEVERSAITWRAVGIAAVVVLLANWLCWYAELETNATYITSGTPPLPAVAAILVMVLLTPLVARVAPRLALRPREMLAVYTFVCVAAPMVSMSVARAFFPMLTALQYFAGPENSFGRLAQHIPSWWAPTDAETIRTFFEGSEGGVVPWYAWAGPMALWLAFHAALFLAIMGLLALLRRQWTEREKLMFPLLYLPLEMAGHARTASWEFFRSPTMWAGFAISAAYNLLNIANAFNPGVTAPGVSFDMGQVFTQHPLSAVRPLIFSYHPMIVGLGYLVPSDVLFSAWFFYLLSKVALVTGAAIGYRPAGWPYLQEQSAGAYVGMALVLVWMGRKHIASELRDRRQRWWAAIGVAGFAFCYAWCQQSGLPPVLAGVFVAMLVLWAMVYARIRAEAGVPFLWSYPFGYQQRTMLSFFGSRGIMALGGEGALTVLSGLSFLARHTFPMMAGGYQIDGMKIAEETRTPQRRMAALMLAAVIFGLVCAWAVHIKAYYEFGGNLVEGGTTEGGYRVSVAIAEYREMAANAERPSGPDVQRIAYTCGGAAFACALVAARSVFLRLPFHPLGYILATCHGDYSPLWGPLFVAWVVKSLVLWIGGRRTYRRLIPAALGLALGHFFAAGMVWGVMSVFVRREVMDRYHITFE